MAGWTDDCSIALPKGRSVEDVVQLVLTCRRGQSSYESTVAELIGYGVHHEEAELAIDRVDGGLFRAELFNRNGNDQNEPSRRKDPLAYASYHLAVADPALTSLIALPETE